MNNNFAVFDDFTKQYKVSKTICFGLHPEGETEKWLEQREYQEAARRKGEKYQIVKPILDAVFKELIDQVLETGIELDWQSLETAVNNYQKDKKQTDALQKQQEKFRKKISDKFTSNDTYKEIFGKNIFKTVLPRYLEQKKAPQDEIDAVKEFESFKTYFENFVDVRKFIFSSTDKQNTVPYRIVNENFMIFLSNKRTFSTIKQSVADMPIQMEEWVKYFETAVYPKCMSQQGIQQYNTVIGKWNEWTNQYIQQHSQEKELKRARLKLRPLHKQILSDREKTVWLPAEFAQGAEGEKQVYAAVNEFEKTLLASDFGKRYVQLLEKTDSNSAHIYIANSKISNVSCALKLGWDGINQAGKKFLPQQKAQKRDISLAQLSEILEKSAMQMQDKEGKIASVKKYLKDGMELWDACMEKQRIYANSIQESQKILNQNEELLAALKAYLDSYQNILHFLNTFQVGDELDKDAAFYAEWDRLYDDISGITSLYNKVRNYATRKAYNTDKIRVMFECSNFLSGWGQEKRKLQNDKVKVMSPFETKNALIFQSENLFYIGVIEKKYSAEEIKYLYENIKDNNKAVWLKYNFQKPNFNKLPQMFIRSKGNRYAPAVSKYQLPVENIIDIYDSGKFKTEYKKKDEKEYRESLEKMIDYFKLGLSKHESYQNFHFQWKPSNEYNDISEFYRDTENSCFYIEKETINFAHLMEQVNQGRMYLFQIVSKDFNKGSKGTDNLHTMYWKQLFSEQNQKMGVIKLCGGASIYMRDASIHDPFTHEKGSRLINKWYHNEDGKWLPVPDEMYEKFQKIVQNTLQEEALTPSEKNVWNRTEKKTAKFDIVKDRRYSQRKYMIHIPLTINYQQADKALHFNEKVRGYLKNNPDVNIIGLDRGERNLIYATIIDQQGKIIVQKSFNDIKQELHGGSKRDIDYHAKLDMVEKNRADARKSWKQIGTIKDLKEGYLSQVIHELTLLMIKYNAIIVMEDLNIGFKSGRMKVEKNVYQKFEKMLIDKLNYLAFKRDEDGNLWDIYTQGGIMNGYQLVDKFTNFKDMTYQNGFLFYVPAAYTSKIDPVTGFADVFLHSEWGTPSKNRDFLKCFDDISWDDGIQSFVFTFDYVKFKCSVTSYQKKWRLVADVERLKTIKTEKGLLKESCNPNQMLADLFDRLLIKYKDGHNLMEELEHMDNSAIYDVLDCFKLVLQMRNSNTERDYIASPVMHNGVLFHSEKADENLPKDADANGAYHIALKGLMFLQRINEYADKDGRVDYEHLKITGADWFKFAQTRGDKHV